MKIRKHASIHTEHIKIFILLGTIILTIIFIIVTKFEEKINLIKPTTLGVSFSHQYAQALGLDPRIIYVEILDTMKVRHLRLNAYWNEIEPYKDNFNFTNLDYYVNEASKRHASVLLAIGYKLPRWPECRAPKWLDSKDLKLLRQRQLVMLKNVISHFEKNQTVSAWQLENEPLLPFGVCPPKDEQFLKDEVAYVRTLTQKPIILTDSGELSTWRGLMGMSDYFGTTLYRTVGVPWLGQWPYPLKPWFYRLKGALAVKLFAPNITKIVISELQAEPWADKFITEVPLYKQQENFSPEQFRKNVEFAQKVGFDEIYLWGVEWWYFMKVQGSPRYWEYANTLF